MKRNVLLRNEKVPLIMSVVYAREVLSLLLRYHSINAYTAVSGTMDMGGSMYEQTMREDDKDKQIERLKSTVRAQERELLKMYKWRMKVRWLVRSALLTLVGLKNIHPDIYESGVKPLEEVIG